MVNSKPVYLDNINSLNLDKARKLIGLTISKFSQKSGKEEINKFIPKNETLINLEKDCPGEWQLCTNDEVCNKMLFTAEKVINKGVGKEEFISIEEDKFFTDNQSNVHFNNLEKCLLNKNSPAAPAPAPVPAPVSAIDSTQMPVTETPKIAIGIVHIPLYKNQDDFNLFNTSLKFKVINLNDNTTTTIFKELNNGLKSIKNIGIDESNKEYLNDPNFKNTSYSIYHRFQLVGGVNDGKSFLNRITYIPIFNNKDEFMNNTVPYFRDNKLSIIGVDKQMSINELKEVGLEDYFFPIESNWSTNSTFKIKGGEFDGKLFYNKTDEIIEKSYLCNLIYNVPFIGNKLCGDKDYSLFFIGSLIILLLLVLFFLFKPRKKEVVKKVITPEKALQIKKAKILQMEYNEDGI